MVTVMGLVVGCWVVGLFPAAAAAAASLQMILLTYRFIIIIGEKARVRLQ